jgi:hypothetical protein
MDCCRFNIFALEATYKASAEVVDFETDTPQSNAGEFDSRFAVELATTEATKTGTFPTENRLSIALSAHKFR